MNRILLEEDFIFNIVITPGTARYFRLFCLSLLKWSGCSYRIISNGCNFDEIELLKKFCCLDRRLSYHFLPFKEKVSHGRALTFLQKKETSPFFCFMDSDILSTGPFLKSITKIINNKTAVFSGLPVWQREGFSILPENANRVRGQFNRTKDNVILGGTYFAIYNNKILNELLCSFFIITSS